MVRRADRARARHGRARSDRAAARRVWPTSATRCEVIELELTDGARTAARLRELRPDAIVHLAWYAEPGRYRHALAENVASARASADPAAGRRRERLPAGRPRRDVCRECRHDHAAHLRRRQDRRPQTVRGVRRGRAERCLRPRVLPLRTGRGRAARHPVGHPVPARGRGDRARPRASSDATTCTSPTSPPRSRPWPARRIAGRRRHLLGLARGRSRTCSRSIGDEIGPAASCSSWASSAPADDEGLDPGRRSRPARTTSAGGRTSTCTPAFETRSTWWTADWRLERDQNGPDRLDRPAARNRVITITVQTPDGPRDVDIYTPEGFAVVADLFTRVGLAEQAVVRGDLARGSRSSRCPEDILMVQELIWKLRPDVIVESGVAHGGALVLYASILELLGPRPGDRRRHRDPQVQPAGDREPSDGPPDHPASRAARPTRRRSRPCAAASRPASGRW